MRLIEFLIYATIIAAFILLYKFMFELVAYSNLPAWVKFLILAG